MMKQKCTKCKSEKDAKDFYKSHTCKTGYDTVCKDCKRKYAIKWRQTGNGKLVNKKSKVKLKTYDMWYFAKLRAQKKGLEFDIDITDIIIPDVCPILGIPIIKENVKQMDNSPSIDRIDNDKGYVKDNIQIISWKANNIKSNGSAYEHRKIIDFMKNPHSPLEYYDNTVTKNRRSKLLYDAKYRSQEKNLEFDISKDDITIPLCCPILGIPLKIDNHKLCEDSPTLDRIDNTKGYVKGNICVISWRANKIKSYGSIEDHVKILTCL